ncbi:hypothetical protein IGI04_025860 [Brassica rapa subsp. trilocularis]|uniref:Secreted protein n=1 Tax=Brassica rapa subsp. trilocularis TaxID=1813537 RepID=A0ABQ7KUM7_BRACM|nr:hypothetical protein IGI04_025860 [Brassica rapa subsp. trilocularis]
MFCGWERSSHGWFFLSRVLLFLCACLALSEISHYLLLCTVTQQIAMKHLYLIRPGAVTLCAIHAPPNKHALDVAWSFGTRGRGLEFWYLSYTYCFTTTRNESRVSSTYLTFYQDELHSLLGMICCSWLYTPSDGAPDQKLILNHKLKTSIHQRARKITNQETASTLMKRLYYQECGL